MVGFGVPFVRGSGRNKISARSGLCQSGFFYLHGFIMNEKRVELWSCGGGRQSAGIAAFIKEGLLPRPDGDFECG